MVACESASKCADTLFLDAGSATADDFMADSMEKFDYLEHVDGDDEKVLQVPRAANLESVDSLLATKTTFQVTCACKHNIKAKGLVVAYKVQVSLLSA